MRLIETMLTALILFSQWKITHRNEKEERKMLTIENHFPMKSATFGTLMTIC